MAEVTHIPELRRKDLESRALDLLSYLQDHDASRREEITTALGWNPHQFTTALHFARTQLCETLQLAIPHPVPEDSFRYRLTGDWIGVDGTPAIEAGCVHALAHVEARLRAIRRDVEIARLRLAPNSVNGRKANYLHKHVGQLVQTLDDIGGPTPRVVETA